MLLIGTFRAPDAMAVFAIGRASGVRGASPRETTVKGDLSGRCAHGSSRRAGWRRDGGARRGPVLGAGRRLPALGGHPPRPAAPHLLPVGRDGHDGPRRGVGGVPRRGRRDPHRRRHRLALHLPAERGEQWTTRVIAEVPAREGIRFNDASVDAAGRVWVGSMHAGETEPLGELYRLDAGGVLTTVVKGVTVSNGLGWSPDGTRMYYADSPMRRIDVFDYDSGIGEAFKRRVFADLSAFDGVPDGLTVDADGCVWVAIWVAASFAGSHRTAPRTRCSRSRSPSHELRLRRPRHDGPVRHKRERRPVRGGTQGPAPRRPPPPPPPRPRGPPKHHHVRHHPRLSVLSDSSARTREIEELKSKL